MKHQRSVLRRRWLPSIALWSTLLLPGCGTPTEPAVEVVTPTIVTDTFSGSIGQNATSVHPFTVTSGGYSLLTGFTALSTSIPALGLGIAAYDSTSATCGLNFTQNDAALSGSTALSGTPGSGTFCLRVYDGGNIPTGETAVYEVQVQHY